MNEILFYILAISIVTILSFLIFRMGYRKGKKQGYEQGAHAILNEWKQTLEIEGEDNIG